MKRISIEAAFLWAQRFAGREWRLILPVALAFVALPPLLLDVLVPDEVWKRLQAGAGAGITVAVQSTGWLFPVSLVILLIGALGGLAITALAIVPRISVQEALALAFRRLGTLVAAMLVVAGGILAVSTIVALLLGFVRMDPMAMQGVLVGVILGISLFVAARLVALAPLIVERRINAFAALRLSWELSQGAFWRLLTALLFYFLGGGIVLLALGTAISAALLVLSSALGSPETGKIVTMVLLRGGAAVVSAGLNLLVVGLYRQLVVSSRGM